MQLGAAGRYLRIANSCGQSLNRERFACRVAAGLRNGLGKRSYCSSNLSMA
jgi:hypothetical protein